MDRDFFFISKVDSCKLSIPLKRIDEVIPQLIEHFTDYRTNRETGETRELKSFLGDPFIIDNTGVDGTYVKIWIETQITHIKVPGGKSSQVGEQYLTILLNSKHLHQDYFRGITKHTLKNIYEYMMSLKVFSCSYEVFAGGRWSDLDICFDFEGTEIEFDVLKKNVLNSVKKREYWFERKLKNNNGLWSPTEREPRKNSTPTKPYVKFYSKELDFKTKSKLFSQTYLKEEQYKNVLRYEVTIKNTQHKRRLGLDEYKTLGDLLNRGDLRVLCGVMFMEYVEKPKRLLDNGESPTDKVLIEMINELIGLNVPSTRIYSIFDRYDVIERSRRNLIKKYHELMDNEKIKKEKLQGNDLTTSVYEYLGLNENQRKIDESKNGKE